MTIERDTIDEWSNCRYSWLWLMTIVLLILVSLPDVIRGHGRMEDPPARNAAWRYGTILWVSWQKVTLLVLGFDVPANYDDVGLDCGGLSVQRTNGLFYPWISVTSDLSSDIFRRKVRCLWWCLREWSSSRIRWQICYEHHRQALRVRCIDWREDFGE